MGFFTLILLFGLLGLISGQDSNKHMICKEVNDIFSNQNHGSYSRRQLQGPMGKRGQPGVKGEPGSSGATGQPGIVDYERLAELLEIEVEKKTGEMASKIKYLEQKHNNFTELVEEYMEELRRMTNCAIQRGVVVRSKCFITDVHATQDTTLSKAGKICRNKGARLADISTEAEFDAIMKNIRNGIPPGTTPRNLWTGMERDKVGNAVLSNGQVSPYKKVRTTANEWTRANSTVRTHVYLYVRPDSIDSDQGLGALQPTYKIEGTLCSIDI